MTNLLVSIFLAAAPWVVSNVQTKGLQTIVLENPLFNQVTARLDCGEEYGEKLVPVPARTRVTVEIHSPTTPRVTPRCEVIEWKP